MSLLVDIYAVLSHSRDMPFEVETTGYFDDWLDGLRDAKAVRIIAGRIVRLSGGLFGDVEPVGEGISELKIDFGPGYRLYFKQRGPVLIVLLIGGDKDTQARDVKRAKKIAAELD